MSMSGSWSGGQHDFARSLNLDCWRAILPYLDNPKDIVAVADASPLLEAFLDETDGLEAAELCVPNQFDVVPLPCYVFHAGNMRRFILHFEDHGRSPFLAPACFFTDISFKFDTVLNLLAQHGIYLRHVKLAFSSFDTNPLEKITHVLRHMPYLERLSVQYFVGSFYIMQPAPPCPQLTQLKLAGSPTLYSVLIRAYGSQLTSLSVEMPCFSHPDLTMEDWNILTKLQRLEIQYNFNSPNDEQGSMFGTLSQAEWPQLKEIRFPLRNYLFGQLHNLSNFRDTLQTIVLDTDRQEHLRFYENNQAQYAIFPNMLELGIAHPRVAPVSEPLRKYFCRTFPNLRRLLLLEGDNDLVKLEFEHLHQYFDDFQNLQEISVAMRIGNYRTFKRRTPSQSTFVCLAFVRERSVTEILEQMRDKLGLLSNIEKLSLDLPFEGNWDNLVVEHYMELPPCPNLKHLNVTKLAWTLMTNDVVQTGILKPIVGSLLNAYGHQLTEVLIGKGSFYGEADLDIWKRLRNLQILRINLFEDECSKAFEILGQLECPRMREIRFYEPVPFNIELRRVLTNFKESLGTLWLNGWNLQSEAGLLPEEKVQVLPILTKLVVNQRLVRERSKTEIWTTLSGQIPNLSELHFVKYAGFGRLLAADMEYYSGLFESVNEIKLVDEYRRQMDHWRRDEAV